MTKVPVVGMAAELMPEKRLQQQHRSGGAVLTADLFLVWAAMSTLASKVSDSKEDDLEKNVQAMLSKQKCPKHC